MFVQRGEEDLVHIIYLSSVYKLIFSEFLCFGGLPVAPLVGDDPVACLLYASMVGGLLLLLLDIYRVGNEWC